MTRASRFLAPLIVLVGCASHPPAKPQRVVLPPRLDAYFERFCGYTANMGIGFIASQTYDFRFRQYLEKTHDPELKRLYVLQELFAEVERDLYDFHKGKRIGKDQYRPYTRAEAEHEAESIDRRIDDLAAYVAFRKFATSGDNLFGVKAQQLDPDWIKDLREDLREVISTSPPEKAPGPSTAP